MKFLSKTWAVNYYKVLNYTIKKAYGDLVLVYSKVHGDNLPILAKIGHCD